MSGSKIIDFHYQFRSKDLTSTLTVPVTIPNPQPASDLVGRLVNAHNLPCYVEEGKKRTNFKKKMLGEMCIHNLSCYEKEGKW